MKKCEQCRRPAYLKCKICNDSLCAQHCFEDRCDLCLFEELEEREGGYPEGFAAGLKEGRKHAPEVEWVRGEMKEAGEYWVCLEDQGGWPFVCRAAVWHELLLQEDGLHAVFPQPPESERPLVMRVDMGGSYVKDLVSSFWKLNAHAPRKEDLPGIPPWYCPPEE